MYKKNSETLIKHLDFIFIDIMVYFVSFWLAYIIRHGLGNMFANSLYVSYLVIIVLLDIFVAVVTRAYKGILFRGYLVELRKVLIHSSLIFIGLVLLAFLQKITGELSRIVLVVFYVISIILDYTLRVIRKKMILKRMSENNEREVIIVSDKKGTEKLIECICEREVIDFNVKGVVLCDAGSDKNILNQIYDVPIIARDKNDFQKYLEQNVVDEILFAEIGDNKEAKAIIEECEMSGMTIHIVIDELSNLIGETAIENMAGISVVSSTIKMVAGSDILLKRIMDIIGGLIGVLITGVAFLIFAPIIYINDPGPIIFSQKRIGRNGRVFNMYKFRSMYKDAELRKKDLESRNEMKGYMFKIENDPRIIGSGKDGTNKGIGHFLRKYSIDELPQFWNVIKGDMSLVGTRPPTLDEWEKYESYHRIRMRIKPGMTGMWQVSGRNDINDFEEVVRLDSKYIRNWSVWEDIKIIIQTFGVVLKKNGAK